MGEGNPNGYEAHRMLGLFFPFSLIFTAISPLFGLIILVISGLCVTALCFWLFLALDFWVPPIMFVLGTASIYTGNVVLQYLAEARQKRWLRGAFNRYVSPAVVESIVNNPSALELGGQEVQATIFFSDLANFTSFSEHLPPKQLVAFLNEYFTPMTKIILEHSGALDKFIGDAIMAFWGAPLPLENLLNMRAMQPSRCSRPLQCYRKAGVSANCPFLKPEWESLRAGCSRQRRLQGAFQLHGAGRYRKSRFPAGGGKQTLRHNHFNQ